MKEPERHQILEEYQQLFKSLLGTINNDYLKGAGERFNQK